MTLYINTLSWAGREKLLTLKESLIPALTGIDYLWTIKENANTDSSVEEIKNWTDVKVNLIQCSHNRDTYSEGQNIIFREVCPKDDDFILTLNNDVIINDSKSLSNMISVLEKDKSLGVVGCKLNYIKNKKLQHAGVLFHPQYGLPFHYRGGMEEEDRDKKNRYFDMITGAVSLMRADTFANAYENPKSKRKGYNEEFFWAFDDIDNTLRIRHHLGLKNLYIGNVGIDHAESASLKKNPVNRMFLDQNRKLFLNYWSKYIDVSLVSKYENAGYNLYK